MNPTRLYKASTVIRNTARIIGLPVTFALFYLFTIMNISELFFIRIQHPLANMPVHIPITVHALTNIAFGILVLSAYIIAWWKERLGGLLFVLASIFVVVLQIVLLIENSRVYQVPGFQWSASYLRSCLMMWAWTGGFPLLIVGILFLITSWLSRRNIISLASQSDAAADI
jgi:hypothetical protein